MPLGATPDQSQYDASTSSTNLVWISDLSSSRKLLKAHVSRSTHARIRRKRIDEYQRATARQNHQQKENRTPEELDFQNSTLPCLTLTDYTTGDVNRCCRDGNNLAYYPYENRTDNSLISVASFSYRDINMLHHPSDPMPKFESFLLNYYIHAIVKDRAENCYNSYENAAMQDWLPVAVTDPGMRMGLFLCASQSLYARTGASWYHQCALRYKVACLRILRDAVQIALGSAHSPSISRVDDSTISIALQLASDEFAAGDSVAWDSHINAIGQMVRLNGGLNSIKGMNGFLRVMVEVLVFKHLHGMILTARSDVNDVSKLYKLEYFLGNYFAESLCHHYCLSGWLH
ncbi:hypothetical protein F4805DRAFT_363684 [Annulohypoxylon moriforme]|nr:hypothetical protein F4805DRAFT_363684 [Annulohypoxylon moriforme]